MNSKLMGRVENGVAAHYDLSISDVFSEAWAKVSGLKAQAWGGLMIIIIAFAVLGLIIGALTGSFNPSSDPDPAHHPFRSILEIVRTLILYPMFVGYIMIGIKRVVDLPTRAMMVFDYYTYFARIAGVFIVSWFIIIIPFMLAGFLFGISAMSDNGILHMLAIVCGIVSILIAIYLAYGFIFAAQLVVEKKLGIWESLQVSRRAVSQHWFKIFFTFLFVGIIVALSAALLLVGLIWSIPFSLAVNGVLYKTLFGVEEARG